MRLGVLAVQGAFREHCLVLERLGCEVVEVRHPADLEGLAGLVIPGGESTSISLVMARNGLEAELRRRVGEGLPTFGTCAGLVMLAREVEGRGLARPLGVMDLLVRRNAFGRQRESFEADLEVPVLGSAPLRAVFIRAPYIASAGPGVQVLARFQGLAVLARQGPYLAAAFHPELTSDPRLHAYFLQMCSVDS